MLLQFKLNYSSLVLRYLISDSYSHNYQNNHMWPEVRLIVPLGIVQVCRITIGIGRWHFQIF